MNPHLPLHSHALSSTSVPLLFPSTTPAVPSTLTRRPSSWAFTCPYRFVSAAAAAAAAATAAAAAPATAAASLSLHTMQHLSLMQSPAC